jgi:hypothetical protein
MTALSVGAARARLLPYAAWWLVHRSKVLLTCSGCTQYCCCGPGVYVMWVMHGIQHKPQGLCGVVTGRPFRCMGKC